MRSPGAAFDLRAALSEEVRDATAELDRSLDDPKALHHCRVHLKRARALARVGHIAAPGLASVFNESARGIMRTLANAREMATLAAAARSAAKKAKKKQAAALEVVAEQFEAARLTLPPPNMEGVRAGLRDLMALAQVWPEASGRQIEKGAGRIAQRARRACRRGRDAENPMRRHEWRKREKDRYYAVEALDKAWPEQRRRRRKLGAKLGALLGREHDTTMLILRIEAEPALAGEAKAAKRALSALKARRAKLAARADDLGAELHSSGV